jgi:DNA-binding Xre family transcriptional regulator
MIKFNIQRILKIKGITEPNKYFIKRGHSSSYAYHLIRNELNSVSFEKLEMLCLDFNCTPNDLFDYSPTQGQNLPLDHALHKLSKDNTIAEVNQLLHDLPMERIIQLHAILKGKE